MLVSGTHVVGLLSYIILRGDVQLGTPLLNCGQLGLNMVMTCTAWLSLTQ